jgi:hypothetical protein
MGKLQLQKTDQLRQIANEIRAYIQKEGIVVFSGGDTGENVQRVYWKRELDGDWLAFLQCAQALGARPIYLFMSEFSPLDLLDAPDENTERRFAGRIGQICLIELSFYWNGLMHSYHVVPEWYGEWEELTDFDFGEEDEDNEEINDIPF